MAEKGKIAEAFVDIVGNLAPLKEALKQARSAVRTSVRAMNKSFSLIGRTFRGIGSTISSVATRIRRALKWAFATVAGAIGTSIYMAGKFEEQLAMVSTMLSAKTMPLMDEYRRRLLELSVSFGQSTQTLSKSLYDILSASIDASKATEVLGVAAKAAIAGMTETAVATDALTSILNAYQMNASKAGEVSDKLFATVKRGKTTFAEIASSIGRTAATAAVAGLSLDELLAMLATMTRMGIKTDEAMTSLNGIIRSFLSPTDEAREAAEKFGVELSSDTLRTKGLIQAVKELQDATKEELATIIPNIRAFKGLAAALQDITGLEEDFMLISQRSAGMTEEAFGKMARTFRFKLAQAKEALKALAVVFGEALLPQAKECLETIRKKLEKARDWVEKNKEKIGEWAVAIKDKLVPKLEEAWDWLNEIYLLLKERDWKAAFDKVVEDAKSALSSLWTYIKPYAKELGETIGENIMSGIRKAVWGGIKAPFATGWAVSEPLRRGVSPGEYVHYLRTGRLEAKKPTLFHKYTTRDVIRSIDALVDRFYKLVGGRHPVQLEPKLTRPVQDLIDGRYPVQLEPELAGAIQKLVSGQYPVQLEPELVKSIQDIVEGRYPVRLEPELVKSLQDLVSGQYAVKLKPEVTESIQDLIGGRYPVQLEYIQGPERFPTYTTIGDWIERRRKEAEEAISEVIEAPRIKPKRKKEVEEEYPYVPGYTRFMDVYKQNLQESLERVKQKIEQVSSIKAELGKEEKESPDYRLAEKILDKLIAQEKRTNELLESILQKQQKNAGAIVY